ncbi:MAG TPA: HAMP domain-containing sensor histidine kinase [Myxococcaceae bacterium]|nr:HAMP domain-containing sensor histidine kinase [Myxococcaceae bacterium]
MSLGRKLVGPQVLLLGLIAGLAATQLLVARSERRQLEETTQRLQQTGLRIQRLAQLFSDTERDLLSEVFTREDVLTRRINASDQEIDRLLEELALADWRPPGGTLLQDLRRLRGPLVEAQRALLRSRAGGESRSAFVRWWFLDQRANAALADLSADNLKGADRILAQVGTTRRRSDVLLLTLTLLCALTVLGMTLYVFRGVIAPLVRLTAASQTVGDGSTVPVLPGRRDELGALSRVLAETTDRLVSTNAELQESLAVRERFLSIAAHELRTPLTSLSLQLSLIQRRIEQGADRETLRANADALGRQARRLTQLVGELLDVTRIQRGRLDLHREPVRLDALVQEVCARCAPLLDAGQNRLTLALEPDVLCEVDPSRLDQVLVNLLGNAARHARGAEIEVRLWTTPGETCLRVRDSGPGIPEAMRVRLFEPFARAPGAAPGLGLGLYISREIVEAHGGRIETTTARGEGTAFTVHLPRAGRLRSARTG